MFEFVRYRVGSSEGSEREIVRTYDLSMPLWIGVFLILMSGLMVWAVGSMSKAVKREHSGPEYFNVTPIVYDPRTIKACLLGAMALGVVTWAIRP